MSDLTLSKGYTISKLARKLGLSLSTLLYYDRMGLLHPSGRTSSGYRYYTEREQRRLERICNFRQAGLTLADIKNILLSEEEPHAGILEIRLKEIGKEIRDLQQKQKVLSGMLKSVTCKDAPQIPDKEMWVAMLCAAGMDDEAMSRWHAEFEERAPEAHHEFLVYLGIPENKIKEIRRRASKWNPEKEKRRYCMSGTKRSEIKQGASVAIVLKKDQRTGKLTEGTVKDILTKSATHPHGIKVRLASGDVGRVKKIL